MSYPTMDTARAARVPTYWQKRFSSLNKNGYCFLVQQHSMLSLDVPLFLDVYGYGSGAHDA